MKRLLMMCCAVLLPAAALCQDAPPPGDGAQAVQDGNAFAADLYRQLRGRDGNLFFSPVSMSTALAMTYAGARGKTADEMARVLHFSLPQERLHPAMKLLLDRLNADGAQGSYKLFLANAVWAQKDYQFNQDFLQVLSDQYDAGINQADFAHNAEQSRKTINAWVAEHTAQHILDLLAQAPPPETRLILTNAVYFKGTWQEQFDTKETQDGDFNVALPMMKHVAAPFMHRTGDFGYLNGGTFQVLEIPYENNALSMIIFLPDSPIGLPIMEQMMNGASLAGWLGRLQPNKVIVSLPKFKIEAQFEMVGTLRQMGMLQPFDPKTADFSGIAELAPQEKLYISAVVHKAYVDVGEEGTEAAAATGVEIAKATAVYRSEPIPVFNADHPFLFLIRDNQSGSILFMGRVADPTQA